MSLRFWSVPVIAFLMSCAQLLSAQNGEVTFNYSGMVYNPAKSLAGDRALNGGGAAFGFTPRGPLTLKAEFQVYGTTTLTYHLPTSPNVTGGSYQSQGNMFTYLFGPQLNFATNKKRLFGEALFGGAHTDAYANLFRAAGVKGVSATNNGFAMAFGGGLDCGFSPHVGVRVFQFDYVMTRYEWKPIGINNQSNFRFQAGLVYLFGRL